MKAAIPMAGGLGGGSWANRQSFYPQCPVRSWVISANAFPDRLGCEFGNAVCYTPLNTQVNINKAAMPDKIVNSVFFVRQATKTAITPANKR